MKKEKSKEEPKKANGIVLLIGFILIILFIVFLPKIEKIFNDEVKPIINDKMNNDAVESTEEIEAISDYYLISENGSFTYNELSVTIKSFENNLLTLSITSSEDENLSDKDYYVGFYEDKSKFIGRRTLKGNVTNKEKDIIIDTTGLNINSGNYIAISHISDDNLPKVTLPTDESGISELKCEKTNYSYKYLFDLDGLYSVTSRITYPYTNADEMANKKIELQKLVKSYNETEGITADTVEGDNKEVIYIEEVDYNVFSGELKEENIYSKGVKASVVKFKNESEGFTCNG